MLDNPHQDQDRDQVGSSFIGSFPDGPDQARIVLSGDIDAPVLARLNLHLNDVLATRPRFVTVDAAAVTRCDLELLDLLGRTQQRLGVSHGLLSVRGLRPHLLPVPGSHWISADPHPVTDPGDGLRGVACVPGQARALLAALTRAGPHSSDTGRAQPGRMAIVFAVSGLAEGCWYGHTGRRLVNCHGSGSSRLFMCPQLPHGG